MADLNAKSYQSGYTGLKGSDIASYLKQTFTVEEEAQAESLISSVETMLAIQCHRNFLIKDSAGVDQVYYEYFDGGKELYRSSNFPINEVTKIQISGSDKYVKGGGSNELTLDTDFIVDRAEIEFLTMVPCAFSNTQRKAVKIFYTLEKFWGSDVIENVKRLVAELMKAREQGGKEIKGYSFAGMRIDFQDNKGMNDIPDYFENLIRSYRRILV
jgi:hypothetical protein